MINSPLHTGRKRLAMQNCPPLSALQSYEDYLPEYIMICKCLASLKRTDYLIVIQLSHSQNLPSNLLPSILYGESSGSNLCPFYLLDFKFIFIQYFSISSPFSPDLVPDCPKVTYLDPAPPPPPPNVQSANSSIITLKSSISLFTL